MKVKPKFIVDYFPVCGDSSVCGEVLQQVINARTELEAKEKFNKRNQGKIVYVHPMYISVNTAKNIWEGDNILFDQFFK